jgi:hypothetical protein
MAIITNQLPFGMHFEIHLCCHSSPFLFFLIKTRFPIVLKDKPNFDLSICKIIQFIDVIPTTFILACIQNVYHSIFLKVHRFIYMQLKLGKIPLDYANFSSTLKEKWCLHHIHHFPMFFCQSIVESFYGFLGMTQIKFVHPRNLYHMVTFLLN